MKPSSFHHISGAIFFIHLLFCLLILNKTKAAPTNQYDFMPKHNNLHSPQHIRNQSQNPPLCSLLQFHHHHQWILQLHRRPQPPRHSLRSLSLPWRCFNRRLSRLRDHCYQRCTTKMSQFEGCYDLVRSVHIAMLEPIYLLY
ncbi:hypothetical protein ACSBR2_015954 [Camellia fascicularis]